MKFVVSHLDQQIGPFDEQELKMKWAAGEILPIDYVFDEEKQDWILLAERFSWAAKPVVKEDSTSGPPPIREGNIMKRMPPPPRAASSHGANGAHTPGPAAPVAAIPAPTPADTRVVSANNIAEGIKLSEPLKLEPLKAQMLEPMEIAEDLKLADEEPELKIEIEKPAVTPTPAPAPKVTQTPIATPAMSKIDSGAKVNMVNGLGEVELNPMNPGEIKLLLAESTSSGLLRMTEPLKINIKASEPVAVEWTVPAQQTVGQDAEVTVRALDTRGVVCAHYSDDYVLVVRGPLSQDIPVKIQNGQAIIKLNHIKAESWNLSLQYTGPRELKMPGSQQLEWQPGAAARLVLDGNHEFLAGDPMKVQIRAVDAYGNTARTFQGQVVLEVKAS